MFNKPSRLLSLVLHFRPLLCPFAIPLCAGVGISTKVSPRSSHDSTETGIVSKAGGDDGTGRVLVKLVQYLKVNATMRNMH